jgi:hypothetical protein
MRPVVVLCAILILAVLFESSQDGWLVGNAPLSPSSSSLSATVALFEAVMSLVEFELTDAQSEVLGLFEPFIYA